MTVDASTGTVSWSPASTDVGNAASLALRVDDGHGGSTEQDFTLSVINPPPDRPPVFTSVPVVDANVNTAYTYQATATDPDGDPLAFSVVSGPQGLAIDSGTGLLSWTPQASQAGTANVILQVADGRGGTALQSYAIYVPQQPGNEAPVITSDPVTQYNLPPAGNPPSESVNPSGLQLILGAGQTSDQTVSIGLAEATPLTLGNTVSSNLATPRQQDHYTFSLAAASLLYFDALTNNGNFAWSLSGPVGTAVSNRAFTNSDGGSVDPVPALPAGSYTLTVSGSGATTGAYSFRLLDLSQAAPLTPGTPVSGTLAPANSTNAYQFSASAGDQYSFVPSTGSGGPLAYWRLIDPYGNVLFSTSLGLDPGTVTLTASGTYTLLVEGYIGDTGTGNYTLNVQFQGNIPPQAPSGTPLSLGSVVNGTLAVAGQQDRYTFSLASASLLYFDALTNDNFAWSLSGPVGTAVSNRAFINSNGFSISGDPVLALPAGSYTLTVSGSGQTTGAYSFRLLDLSQAAPPDAGHAGQRHPGPRQQHQRLPVQRQRRPVLLLRPALGQQR